MKNNNYNSVSNLEQASLFHLVNTSSSIEQYKILSSNLKPILAVCDRKKFINETEIYIKNVNGKIAYFKRFGFVFPTFVHLMMNTVLNGEFSKDAIEAYIQKKISKSEFLKNNLECKIRKHQKYGVAKFKKTYILIDLSLNTSYVEKVLNQK